MNLCSLDPSKAKTTFNSFGVHDIICKDTVLRFNPKMMKMGTAFTVALRSSRPVSSLIFVIRGRKKGREAGEDSLMERYDPVCLSAP